MVSQLDSHNATIRPRCLCMSKKLSTKDTLSFKRVLCWIPIPSAALQPKIRLLFIALEATFSYVLWAMRTTKGNHVMTHIYPGPSISMTGLECSNMRASVRIAASTKVSRATLNFLRMMSKLWLFKRNRTAPRNKLLVVRTIIKCRWGIIVTSIFIERLPEAPREELSTQKKSRHEIKKPPKSTELIKPTISSFAIQLGQRCPTLTDHNNSKKHLGKAAQMADPKNKHSCILCVYATRKSTDLKNYLKSSAPCGTSFWT